MIEWKAEREPASRFLPKHTAAAAWKHRNLSHVEQVGLPKPKDRGAGQGDVDGPLECSLALGMVAAETRGSIGARQAAGTLPWIGLNDSAEEQRLQAGRRPDCRNQPHRSSRPATRIAGHMDDGDILCHPILVPPFLREFDVANA